MQFHTVTLLLSLLFAPALLIGSAANAADEAPTDVPFTVPMDADGVQRTKVTIDSYSYSPSHLVVQVGKPVELTLVSESSFAPHNLVINAPTSGLSIHQDVGSGKTVKLTFTPTKTGSFAFFCDKKAPFMASHREKGMEGVLEVR